MNAEPVNHETQSAATGQSAAPGQIAKWSRTRWFTLIVLAFLGYVAFVIAAGDRKKIVSRAVKNIPALKIFSGQSEVSALNDPTLFALPQQHDFAMLAWDEMPRTRQPSFRWSEPPRWLPLTEDQLGAVFHNFMRTNLVSDIKLEFKPPPLFTRPSPIVEPAIVQNSTMRIEGLLTQRKLISPMNVPSFSYDDAIAPTRIQALVDAKGEVVSVVPLESSGWDIADQRALELARNARFTPAATATMGQLIFNWHTIPMPPTNTVSP